MSMTSGPADGSEPAEQGASSGDDTAAFQRFYLSDTPKEPRSLLYRLLVGWWRD
ncbi:MAG: hypothetical protein FWC87_00970 [Acidimicrobiaceae bacterium]|nr:hypothetical protein [Acidimicrobiaceae bacterium]